MILYEMQENNMKVVLITLILQQNSVYAKCEPKVSIYQI
jgi:hypothetical protein